MSEIFVVYYYSEVAFSRVQSHLCQDSRRFKMLGVFWKAKWSVGMHFILPKTLPHELVSCFFSLYPHDTLRVSWGKKFKYMLSKKLGSYYFGISSSCALCWKECCNEHNCETFQFVWFLNGLDPLDKHWQNVFEHFSPLGSSYLPTPKEGS